MTTREAASAYLAEHLSKLIGRGYAVVNPNGRPVEELPVIYGFNNGGQYGWMHAVLVAEDGTLLGGHICSEEAYMPSDLGILEGTRPDRHETFLAHYPGGYRMEFVPRTEIDAHPKLPAILASLNAKNGVAEETS